ncbi:MAG TPA: PAS domain-containing sensor histidine kinase [Flavobacteriaceae bacterium]|nr:PAS domain-containing sensor histidine kinase [Flavobacteriaceae bacterium]
MIKVKNKVSAHLGSLFEIVSEGIVVVDSKQNIVTYNQVVNDIFGYKENELLNKSVHVLVPQEHHHTHKKQVAGYSHNASTRQMGVGRDLHGVRKDKTTFPIEVGLNPFTLDGEQYVMAILIDISVRKEQEREIKELNTKLEHKINLRTIELQETVDSLESEIKRREEAENKILESLRVERELNELKTKFLSMVSHEFKTPLSGILTSATLAGKYQKSEQQDKRERHLKLIEDKVKYLNNILNDFLSVEQLEYGRTKYKMESFPLSKILNEVIYSANMLLKEGQSIVYPENIEDIVLVSDETTLEIILSNLINNAVKYSSENTTIKIIVEKEEEFFNLQIVDQGIGIPEKEQKHIFNRYFRAENALLDEGTGIGLNIVKGHIENLGGTISFESEENVGSTFHIRMPLNASV